MNFSYEAWIFITFIFCLAAFIHGSIGFGFPMVATPLLALFTDIQTARRHLSLALFAMLGSAVGTQIMLSVNSDIFKGLLGIVIIIYLLVEKTKLKLSWIRLYPRLSKLTFGVSAGLVGGLTNVMAPVLIIYSLESKHSKIEIVQASNLCFLFGKIIQIFLFTLNDKFTLNELSTSAVMLIVSSIGLYVGIVLKKKINEGGYRKIIRALLFTLSAVLLIQVSV
jgi:uncharacterized membrane protein YfcA